MIGSAQHELAKYLTSLFQPVLDIYLSNCIKDSFSFAQEIQQLDADPSNSFLCSFDISSLFTNVPLAETIKICADTLYNGKLISPDFPKSIFIELMNTATSSIEFSFSNTMYKQTDGIAMGSPLGPVLASIFVGYHESLLFDSTIKPCMYQRNVDDIFAIFKTENDSKIFYNKLNLLYPSLKFTMEKETDDTLQFLDVNFEKDTNNFLISVYRNPTFVGQYTRWDSFGPPKRKTNLIDTLIYRAPKICSKNKLQQKLNYIRSILRDNGYLKNIINTSISKKITQFQEQSEEGPQKCPVYLCLLWIGKVSLKFEKQTKSAIKECYNAVQPRIMFSTKKILPSIYKDHVPTTQQSIWSYINTYAAVIAGTWAELR